MAVPISTHIAVGALVFPSALDAVGTAESIGSTRVQGNVAEHVGLFWRHRNVVKYSRLSVEDFAKLTEAFAAEYIEAWADRGARILARALQFFRRSLGCPSDCFRWLVAAALSLASAGARSRENRRISRNFPELLGFYSCGCKRAHRASSPQFAEGHGCAARIGFGRRQLYNKEGIT